MKKTPLRLKIIQKKSIQMYFSYKITILKHIKIFFIFNGAFHCIFLFHDVCYFSTLTVKQTFLYCSLVEHFTTALFYLYLLMNKQSESPFSHIKRQKASR